MSEFISCFACDKEPTQQCPRCGRPYCDDHGEELCDACLEPASGVPSFTLYRGSLLALLFGTLLAVWLLIKPPETSDALRPEVVPTQTAVVQANTTPPPNTTVVTNGSPVATRPATTTTAGAGTTPTGPTATRPATTTTPAAGTTPGAGGSTNYTVVSGDTLGAICEKVKPASMTNADCVTQIVSLNGFSSDSATINVGQVIKVPAR